MADEREIGGDLPRRHIRASCGEAAGEDRDGRHEERLEHTATKHPILIVLDPDPVEAAFDLVQARSYVLTVSNEPVAPRPSRLRKLGRDAVSLVVFVSVALSARASLADHYVVPTGSMIPTVHEGDRVFVSKAAYGLRLPLSSTWLLRWHGPARGDVVVLESPTDGTVLLKRIVAREGDEISVQDGRLILNGQQVACTDHDETLDGKTHPVSLDSGGGPDFGPAKVPAGKVLVMGDNRGNSRDGRMFGFVDVSAILGRALAVYSRDGSLVWNEL